MGAIWTIATSGRMLGREKDAGIVVRALDRQIESSTSSATAAVQWYCAVSACVSVWPTLTQAQRSAVSSLCVAFLTQPGTKDAVAVRHALWIVEQTSKAKTAASGKSSPDDSAVESVLGALSTPAASVRCALARVRLARLCASVATPPALAVLASMAEDVSFRVIQEVAEQMTKLLEVRRDVVSFLFVLSAFVSLHTVAQSMLFSAFGSEFVVCCHGCFSSFEASTSLCSIKSDRNSSKVNFCLFFYPNVSLFFILSFVFQMLVSKWWCK